MWTYLFSSSLVEEPKQFKLDTSAYSPRKEGTSRINMNYSFFFQIVEYESGKKVAELLVRLLRIIRLRNYLSTVARVTGQRFNVIEWEPRSRPLASHFFGKVGPAASLNLSI